MNKIKPNTKFSMSELLPNKPQQHLEIVTQLNDVYTRKNADYGDSFGRGIDEFGFISALVRISDKYNRIKELLLDTKGTQVKGTQVKETQVKGTQFKETQVKDESVEDTLLDLANYSIMTLIEVRNRKEKLETIDNVLNGEPSETIVIHKTPSARKKEIEWTPERVELKKKLEKIISPVPYGISGVNIDDDDSYVDDDSNVEDDEGRLYDEIR